MEMCFDCLVRAKPWWIGRYLLVWYVFLLAGGVAFFGLNGDAARIGQVAFFVILFPLICWPVVAAIMPRRGPPRAN